MSLTYGSAPWEAPREAGECDSFESPADFVVKVTNYDFTAQATSTVFSNLAKDTILTEAIPLQSDQLGRVLRVMSKLGRHYLNSIVRSLTIWRTSMNPLSMMDLDFTGKKKAAKKSGNSEISDDRIALVVDYIFVTALLPLIQHYDGTNVDNDPLLQIEDGILKSIMSYAIPHGGLSEPHMKNQLYVKTQFLEILRHIAPYRMQTLSDQLFKYIEDNIKNQQVVMTALDGTRLLRLSTDAAFMEGNFTFLNKFHTNWKNWVVKNKSKEQRNALCEYLGHVLKTATSATKESQSDQWKKLVWAVHPNVDALLKKTKNAPFLLPVMSSILALHTQDFFAKNYEPLLETTLAPQKDASARVLGLESSFTLVNAACTKYDDGNAGRLQKVVSFVGKLMYPVNAKKVPFTPNLVNMEQMVHITEILSMADAESVSSSVVQPLLSSAIPEAHIVGLMAGTMAFLDGIHFKVKPSSAFDDPSLEYYNSFRLSALEEERARRAGSDPVVSQSALPLLGKCQAAVMRANHAQVGTVLVNAGTVPAATPLWALKAAVFSLYAVLPAGEGHMQLLENVCSYTIHSDVGLQNDALRVIKYIIEYRPQYRADMAHAFAKFLPKIPASLHSLVNERLRYFVELLKLWRNEENGDEYPPLRQFEPKPESKIIDPNRMGGIALLYLCSAQPSRRELAYEIIELSRTIYERTCGSDVPPHDLFAIIAAYEEDIVGQSTYVRSKLWNDPDVPNERKAKKHSLRDMLQKTMPEDQLQWTHALGGLVSYATGEVEALGKTIWESVSNHVLPALAVVERGTPQDPKFLKHVCEFQNYLTVALASSDRGDAKELIRTVLPFVRGQTAPLRIAAEVALGFLPQGGFGALLQEAQALERAAFAEDKAGKLRQKKCNQMAVLAYLYRIIAENKRTGYIVHGTNAAPLFAHLGQQLEKFPGQVSIRADDDVLEWQFRRYNLSMFLYHIATDIAFAGKSISEVMTPKLYNKALEFLSETSGCTHMVTGSTELDSAQMKLDRGVYKPLVEALPAEERAAKMDHFTANARAVEYMGQRAMAAMFASPQDPMGTRLVFVWYTNVFARRDAFSNKFVRPSLLGVLRFNPPMLATMMERAYGFDNPVEAAAFAHTVAVAYNTGEVAMAPAVALTFATYKMLDADEDVRAGASHMASLVFQRELNESFDVTTRSTVYDALLEKIGAIFQQLADRFPELSSAVIEEVFARLRMVNDPGRERLLRFATPWIVNKRLDAAHGLESVGAFLEQLTLITLDYDRLFFSHVQDMWMHLASNEDNALRIMNFLVSQGVSKRNSDFITVCRKVSVLVSRAQPSIVANALLEEFSSIEKVSFPEDSLPPPDEIALITAENAKKAMKDSWERDAKYKFERAIECKPLSRADMALVMLLDVLVEHNAEVVASAHTVLHQCVMNLDDANSMVSAMSKRVLFSLVNLLNPAGAEQKVALLASLKVDADGPLYEKRDFRCTATSVLADVVGAIASLCSEEVCTGIADRAVGILRDADDEHAKIRSMQIIAALKRSPSHQVLQQVFHVLTNNVGDYLNELALEALHTVSTIVAYSSEAEVLAVPQVLWLAVAFLLSEVHDEYHIGAQLLIAVLQKLNFAEEAAQNMVASSFPKDWSCQFDGLQTLVLKGLLSEPTLEDSVALLQEFTLLECDALVETGPTRLVDNLIGQLPWLVHKIGDVGAPEKKAVMSIATVCNLLQQPELGQVFRSFADGKYEDAETFLMEFAAIFCKTHLVGHEIRALTFLWELRFEGPALMHVPAMQTARALMMHMDFSNKKLANQVLLYLFILKQALEFDDWEHVAGVFDAVLVNCNEKFEFNMFHDVSQLSKQLGDKFQPRHKKTWDSDDKGRASLLDALGKVMLSIPSTASVPEVKDTRSDDALFPCVELGKVYSSSYKEQVLKEGGQCKIAKMENPERRILRVRAAEDVDQRRQSRSMTLRLEQPAPSPRRSTSLSRSDGMSSPASPSSSTPPRSKLASSSGSEEMPPPPPPRNTDNDQPPAPPSRDFPPPTVSKASESRFPPPPVEIAPPPPPR